MKVHIFKSEMRLAEFLIKEYVNRGTELSPLTLFTITDYHSANKQISMSNLNMPTIGINILLLSYKV